MRNMLLEFFNGVERDKMHVGVRDFFANNFDPYALRF
jgi:hypothetical protein